MRKLLTTILFSTFFFTLIQGQIAKRAEDISPLLIGETIPNSPLINLDLETVNFHDIVKNKPSILIVYRGGWCPYCIRHLAEIGKIEQEILDLGYQIIALTPESVENLSQLKNEENISYQLFSDPKGTLLQQIGLAFEASEKTLGYIKRKTKGEISTTLPVPAILVLNVNAEILFEHINPDYKQRMEAHYLLAVLQALSK